MKKGLILIAGILSINLSCVSVEKKSFLDPEYNSPKFSSIAIFANTTDLILKNKLEISIVSLLKNKRTNSIESFKIFPPTRNFNEQEIFAKLLENNISSVLKISFLSVPNHYQFPELITKVELYDISKQKIAWSSSYNLQGDSDATDNLVYDRFSNTLVGDLLIYNLVKTK